MTRTIPERMQAVQLEENGGRLLVRQIPVPRPGPGEVLIRMAASPINPSDLFFLAGNYAFQKPFPVVPGLEGSGTVVDAGKGLVPRMWMGKRVACAAAQTSDGTWAEYMVTSAMLCFPLPKNFSLEQGAMLIVNPMTAISFFDIAKSEKHAAIVSTAAAGALGRMIVRLGRQHGLPVINIVRRQEQVELLESLGAQYVLNSLDEGFPDRLCTLAHQLKATLFLDAVGGGMTQQLLDAAPSGGTVLVYSNLSGEPSIFNAETLIFGDKKIAGFFLANQAAKKSFIARLRVTQRVKKLAAEALQTAVQKRLPLSAVQEALEIYESNMTAGKVLLVANPEKE
jgi:NADPH:quinone reductase-like Zn-dependent oxidoreductase